MQLHVNSGQIQYSGGAVPALHPVLEAREIGPLVVVVYDYMAFPRGAPSRNLFAYSTKSGQLVWRAEDIGAGATDGYTNIISEQPLVVGNFACFNCEIDLNSGKVLTKVFTK
jgi:hypothetical protein